MIVLVVICALGMYLIPVMVVIDTFSHSVAEGFQMLGLLIAATYWLIKSSFLWDKQKDTPNDKH